MDMMNFESIFKAMQAKDKFMSNHPKMEQFLNNVQAKGFCEKQEIAVAVRYPDGTEYKTGLWVTQSDLELLNALKNLRG